MENQGAYLEARKRAEAKFGFYIHLAVYVAVSALLVVINLSTASGYMWAQWPLIGWGIGLLFHALGVFVFYGQSAVTERMIERELKRGV